MSLFAAPIATRMLEDAEELNAELTTLLLSRETEEYRNPYPTHMQQREVYESNFDMFRWTEPCIRTLRAFVLDSIVEVVAELSGYTREDVAQFQVHNHTWFHVSRHGGSFIAHNHPMASWSAVYCVSPGEASEERRDSGVLRFLDHRPGSNMFMDPANVKLRMPFNFGHYSVRLAAGQLVIFPSYLVHEVATFMGNDERITVATNCWFSQRARPAEPSR